MKNFQYQLGVIGCGNMGSAIIGGVLQSGLLKPEHIGVYDSNEPQLKKNYEKFGFKSAPSIKNIFLESDIIILAVKPDVYIPVIREVKDYLQEHQIIVSIAAGISMDTIEKAFERSVKLVRAMPNTPALIGCAMTGICSNNSCMDKDIEAVERIFTSFGRVEQIKEEWMAAFTGISGSSPAYVYMFIEALSDGGVLNGLPRDKAINAAAQAVLGAAKMVLETNQHPGILKDQVCSPGGTTIEAVKELENRNFRGTVISAVDECAKKFNQMLAKK